MGKEEKDVEKDPFSVERTCVNCTVLYCIGLGEKCLAGFVLVIKFTMWSWVYLEDLLSRAKFPHEE